MSTTITYDRGQDQPQPARSPNRITGIAFAVAAIVAAIALLAINPQLLVALSSDKDGQALLPSSTLAPGGSTTGALMLTNEGLLPLRYDVRIQAGAQELDSGVIIRLRRNDEPNFFYQGAITTEPINIGFLAPGQHTRIEVTLSAPAAGGTAAIPVDETFVWTAHSPGIDFWWWLLVVALVLVAAAFALPRLLDLYSRVRRHPKLKFELFWRAPVALAAVILAMLVPLSGVSLSTINAQASNPGNVFGIGSVVLNNRTMSGTTCISAAGEGGPAASGTCGAIFQVQGAVPGTSSSGRVTIRNQGTVPISRLSLWAPAECVTSSPANTINGGGDLCRRVQMTIHDDSHDLCYFPDTKAGPCALRAAGTMAAFASRYVPGKPLALSPDGLGSGITYTFQVALDQGAGNEYQGRLATLDFTWEIAQ
jgi:hypothetical protein